MEILLHAVSNTFAELCLHLALDDEHHVAEACAPCVKQRKIDNDMCPSGSTGSICLRPPKRLPMPAAMIIRAGVDGSYSASVPVFLRLNRVRFL